MARKADTRNKKEFVSIIQANVTGIVLLQMA